MNEFAWLPGCAPATRLFNPCTSGAAKTGASCSLPVRFSIFFDGTRNHSTEDRLSGSHSNVARLYDACTDNEKIGEFRLYVQGVGTPFPEIGEPEPHEHGARDGEYGDRRLRYAFLFMANKMSELLCGDRVVSERLEAIIEAVESDDQIRGVRRALDKVLADPKPSAPVISMITLDLFGFSRGATAARAFLNHLFEWAGDHKPQVCGIPLRVRFMGLFDTVASVERADSMPGPGDGHLRWALPDLMLVPPFVEQCVHMVAGYEARNSFPLTTISATRDDGHRRLEIVYPGAHADVGGGYGPTSQGKGTQSGESRPRQHQKDLLSQIPLNDMYERALNAGVPLMRRENISDSELSPFFAVSPELERNFNAHQQTLRHLRGGAPLLRLMHAHYIAYIGWRRHVLPRATFINLPFMVHCKNTQMQDHINLDQANVELLVYLETFRNLYGRARVLTKELLVFDYMTREHACMQMYDRYWESAAEPEAPVKALLEQYVHDSRAGFVLTDPQCERDYEIIRKRLETKDAAYQAAMRRHRKILLPNHQRRMAANPTLDEGAPPEPVDPLSSADREALALYRRGIKPIFTDAKPASSMDGKQDAKDVIALLSRREVRWSYLRRRQVFRPVFKVRDNARGEVVSRGYSKRLCYEDGLT